MRNPLTAVGAWSRKAFLAIKAFEDAQDERCGDCAQRRFDRLERRIAALEDACPRPSLAPHPLSSGRMNP